MLLQKQFILIFIWMVGNKGIKLFMELLIN